MMLDWHLNSQNKCLHSVYLCMEREKVNTLRVLQTPQGIYYYERNSNTHIHTDLSMTLRSNAPEWYTLSYCPEQTKTDIIDLLKEGRMQPHHHKHKILNATIFLSKDSWWDLETRQRWGENPERQNFFPNETHFPNEVGHGKWVCKSYFVLIMF